MIERLRAEEYDRLNKAAMSDLPCTKVGEVALEIVNERLRPQPSVRPPWDGRPNWDEWGLALASTVALRADCTRRQVGAVLMTPDHSIVATGYNGAPAGQPGCMTAQACPRGLSSVEPGSSYDTGAGVCIALHAEQNALLRATWEDMFSSTLYVTDEPCDGCWRMIQGTPIYLVVYPTGNRRNR